MYWKILVGVLGGIAVAILNFLEKNKDIISKIALRIEKDSQDGWTHEEKEQFAVDMYFNEAQSLLPWYLKLFSKTFRYIFIEKIIRKLIKSLCAETKKLPKIIK